MKNFYIQLSITILSALGANAMRRFQFGHEAVTGGVDLEDLYVRIKDEIPYTYLDDGEGGQLREPDYTTYIHISYEDYPKPELKTKETPSGLRFTHDLEGKSDICVHIFNSPFYDMQDEEAVPLDSTETKQYLKQNYENVYNEIYTTEPVYHTEWPNAYMLRDVRVGGKEYQERTFRCLTRKRTAEAGIYIEYFISAIYQSTSPECPINGRFVFNTDETKRLKLSAVTEKPGVFYDALIANIHNAYFNARNDKHPEPAEVSSPLCTMSDLDKIRLCGVVLNSPGFPEKVKFWPSQDNVESGCEMKKVIARERVDEVSKFLHLHSEADVKMMYDERMIGCKAIRVPKVSAQEQKVPAQTASELGGEDTKSATIPSSDTTDAEKAKPATETYYIGAGLRRETVIVFKRSTKTTFTPFVGMEVHLMAAPGTLKPISILEYHKV